MREHEAVTALINRIVAGAQIPSRAERENLRRELWTHFEDAAGAPEEIPMAIRRFGAEAIVAASFRQVYRFDYMLLYLVKIAASIVASIAAALVIQVLFNLRVEVAAEVWRLAPRFSHAAIMSVGIVLGLVTAWEVGRRPFNRSAAAVAIGAYAAAWAIVAVAFTEGMVPFAMATILVALGYACSRLERWRVRVAVAFGAFAATLYVTHLALSVTLDLGRMALSSGAYVAIWATTVAIWARLDLAFSSVFGTVAKRTL